MVSCPLLPLSVGTDTPRRRAAASPRPWDTASIASGGKTKFRDRSKKDFTAAEGCGMLIISVCRISWGRTTGPQACIIFYLIMLKKGR